MLGKGGQATVVVLWALIIVLIGVVLVFYINSVGVDATALENLPDAVASVYESIVKIADPIVGGLFFVVAPVGEDENVQMIAFAIFLLIVLVGYRSLNPFFKSTFVSFLISAIIGIIAARSLTASVLDESALAASPIAAVSLLIGFIPIFALTQNIDKWGLNQFSKIVVFTFAAVVYSLIFAFAFNALTLGVVYGVGIVLLGAGQIMGPWFAAKKAKNLGKYLAGVEKTINTAESMQEGSESLVS